MRLSEVVRGEAFGDMSRRWPGERPRMRAADLDSPLEWTIAERICNRLSKADR